MSEKLIALVTKRSYVNPNKIYVNAGDEVKLEKVHDEEFSFVTVVSTNEKIIIRSLDIGYANGQVFKADVERVKNKKPSKKSSKKSSSNQGELF